MIPLQPLTDAEVEATCGRCQELLYELDSERAARQAAEAEAALYQEFFDAHEAVERETIGFDLHNASVERLKHAYTAVKRNTAPPPGVARWQAAAEAVRAVVGPLPEQGVARDEPAIEAVDALAEAAREAGLLP